MGVHLNAGGTRAAVLGSMIDVGAPVDHPIFEKYLLAWEAARDDVECGECDLEEEGEVDNNYPVAPCDLLVSDDYYHYDGGLTTPPCSEIVWWNFNVESMLISVSQYGRLVDIILRTKTQPEGDTCDYITVASGAGSTSRPVQPLNGRTVDKICNREMITKKDNKAKATKSNKASKSGKSTKAKKSKK